MTFSILVCSYVKQYVVFFEKTFALEVRANTVFALDK